MKALGAYSVPDLQGDLLVRVFDRETLSVNGVRGRGLRGVDELTLHEALDDGGLANTVVAKNDDFVGLLFVHPLNSIL